MLSFNYELFIIISDRCQLPALVINMERGERYEIKHNTGFYTAMAKRSTPELKDQMLNSPVGISLSIVRAEY